TFFPSKSASHCGDRGQNSGTFSLKIRQLTTSKSVKPHTPHPTPHTLPPPKSFFSKPYLKSSICNNYLQSSIY
ncbi:hypothetical protein, partial [Microcystis sp. M179S2]|uniref:hypothetical protein n=1 Tax=Microcystis sp. M179S2 TaxID=2771160 RepID=UPI00258883B4